MISTAGLIALVVAILATLGFTTTIIVLFRKGARAQVTSKVAEETVERMEELQDIQASELAQDDQEWIFQKPRRWWHRR